MKRLTRKELTNRAELLIARISSLYLSDATDLTHILQAEIAFVQFIHVILAGPYLSLKGKRYVEEQLTVITQLIRSIENA